MGGNLFPNTKRKSIDEYNKIKTEVLNILQPHIKCETYIEAPEKEDFGDLDILYLLDNKVNVRTLILDLFNSPPIVKRGHNISFLYNSFQIDMAKVATVEEFECKKFFNSYGDFGCIIGKMLYFYKLKFGDKGLWIHIERTIDGAELGVKQNIDTKLYLTNKPNEICDFLGLDYKRWLRGFQTQIELFDFICSSKYFIRNIFQIENTDDRSRFERRIIYKNFMDYIWKDDNDTTKPNKVYMQKYAIDYFNKQKELDEIIMKIKLNEEKRNKYNGHLFIEAGIYGKEICIKMKEFETIIEKTTNKQFNQWLDETDNITVKNMLNEFIESNK